MVAINPDVYVLDEPSSNLDVGAIRKIKEIIGMLKSMGKMIVIAEHRIYYLKDLVDRAIHLEGGKIAGEYSMEELSAFEDAKRFQTGIRSIYFPKYSPRNMSLSGEDARLDMRFLSFGYEKEQVLDIAKANISAGQITAIIGENGAGKSIFVMVCLSKQ